MYTPYNLNIDFYNYLLITEIIRYITNEIYIYIYIY